MAVLAVQRRRAGAAAVPRQAQQQQEARRGGTGREQGRELAGWRSRGATLSGCAGRCSSAGECVQVNLQLIHGLGDAQLSHVRVHRQILKRFDPRNDRWAPIHCCYTIYALCSLYIPQGLCTGMSSPSQCQHCQCLCACSCC